MHHLYPLVKGDPLCPLGFHPQVRWPTRCKRCFRDYKEHGGRRRDEDSSTTASTPSLSWNSRDSDGEKRRSWVSSSNLAGNNNERSDSRNSTSSTSSDYSNPSSWTSTPDLANLEDDTQAVTTVNIQLPKRRLKPIDTGQRTVSDSFSVLKSDITTTVFNKNDSLATRAKKLRAIKGQTADRAKRIQVKEVKTICEEPTNHDVQFLIQVKTKPSPPEEHYSDNDDDADTFSTAGTETTDTTLVDSVDHELHEQLESFKKELEMTKAKCDRLERDKSDILLRRLAAMETTTSKTTATEVLKLQQKCNELQQTLEDCKDEKRSLTLRVKELEDDLEQRPTAQQAQKLADELRSKLLAAETLCEELMDENEDIKKEMRDMEEQMDEMQDNFREEQAVEYTSLKKELDQTTKNCRILSFKLRKAERKSEQLEQEKAEAEKKLKDISGAQSSLANLEKLKRLEQDLKLANEVSIRVQKELDQANNKLNQFEETNKTQTKKKAPLLGSIGKFPSADTKVSRESLTRGGSQDDPVQLLRDLQDSMEREADLREQLKFAEEESQNLRKKVSRIEDDNESLVLQLKKMATRARSRKLSPTNAGLTPEPHSEKGDVFDDEDPAEIKLQLELSEQEASVLRRKVEDLEADNHRIKNKNKELQDKLTAKSTSKLSLLTGEKGTTLQSKKLKILGDEANDLRKKLIEKERDCERLHAELSLNQKRTTKGVPKSKSLELDQQTLDLKRQLQIVEQEASVLRSRVQNLENDNEKLTAENKRIQLLRGAKSLKSDKNLDKYIDQIATLEVELADKNSQLKELEDKLSRNQPEVKEVSAKYKRFVDRTPKKISNLTSKEQLKAMVNDLESEIGEMIVAIKTSENEKIKLEEEMKKLKNQTQVNEATKALQEINEKFDQTRKELDEEKDKCEELNKTLAKTKESLAKATQEKKKFKEQIDKNNEEQQRILAEKRKLDEEVLQLRSNLKTAAYKQDELTILTQKAQTLKLNLDSKDKELKALMKELEEKAKQITDLTEKNGKLLEIEKKYNQLEEKLKKSEKCEKDKVKELQNFIESEKTKTKSKETENEKLNCQIVELNNKIASLETTIASKNKLIERLEENLKKERENLSKTNLKVGELENHEIAKLKDELAHSRTNLKEIENKLGASKRSHKEVEDKLKKSEADNKTSKMKTEEIGIELQNEKKKMETLKSNYEKEMKNKEQELTSLKSKMKALEQNSVAGTKRVAEIKQFQESIEKMEANLKKEKQKYDELTAKYEILEEEHVVTKAKLVMEKETLENQLSSVKREMKEVEGELKTLRDTYNTKHDSWIKEKLNIQQKVEELEKKSGSNLEKGRFKASLDDKQSELDKIKKENDAMNDQMEYMRKENDELRRKLDDYEKVNKVQRNISADSSAMEKEIGKLKAKLSTMEKSKKLDLADCKMRYDNQLSIVNGELQQLQSQIMRFKRERDTFKHMLESAQKTIGDLKNSLPNKKQKDQSTTILHYDELDEAKTKIATLEQQISCMEDELSEARLESSRLKTELVSERSSWEVKMSELHSRVNELEEEKILSSGRTKIVGLRTRMELAWQKEREEQQRLLQETATLARDLRQTLFEVERERDKERLESKRKQDQFKKSNEEDQDENKKKITELQCDLLELRDAHAKLRTTNEKLRREKERFEKEREELKSSMSGKKRTNQEDDRKVNVFIEQIDSLKQLAPELFSSKDKNVAPYTPTPPRRTRGSKSRETSPAIEARVEPQTAEQKQDEVHLLMQRLVNTADEFRRYQCLDDDLEKERIKRSLGMRRATSTEHDAIIGDGRYISNKKYISTRKKSDASLRRKSLSLEHTIQDEQKIWKNDDNDSMSSLQSIDMSSDVERWSSAKRDTSLDSRLSGGSTQSDVVGEKKKKKGIIGKLKKLTKSRSIDDQDPGTFPPNRSLTVRPNSNSTDPTEEKGSKKDLRERITGIFKKTGSSSRGNSAERQPNENRHDTSSTHRPLTRNSSNGNIAPPNTTRK